MSSCLQVRLFGPLEISLDGSPLPKPATLKSQSLFAYLILHRQNPCPRAYLSGLFWGERPEQKARGSLATALWHIRRCLPEKSLLLIEGETVQFDLQAEIWVDVEEFETLATTNTSEAICSGVGLYRGDFLAGFYDGWVLEERYRQEGLYASALAQLMLSQDAAGDARAALLTARRLLTLDPLREEAHRLVMRACCQLGQRNQALEQYRTCRQTLLSELGVEPMAETTELYQAILDGRLQAGPMPASVFTEIPPLTVPASPVRDPLDAALFSRMVGRESEIAFLNHHWKETISARGRLIFIGGEAGVGKTRLVGEFADSLRLQGIRVLSGRCYEYERILPYQPVIDTLKSALPTLSSAETKLVPPWLRANEAQFSSGREERVPDVGHADTGSHDQTHFFDNMLDFFAGLSADGPVLIVLEDLHWATESTLQLLHYLVRHLAERPVLLLCTYRSEEISLQHPFWNFQNGLQKENHSLSLHLARLSESDVENLVMEMSGGCETAAGLARRLYQETEGNPFFLIEIIKALFEKGIIQIEEGEWKVEPDQLVQGQMPLPASISQTILSRVRDLNVTVQNALRVAATLGREFDFELLNQVLDRGEDATLDALDTLLRQRLIGEGSGQSGRDYVFTHHKIQETIYSDLPRQQCKRYHARVAEVMERMYELHLDEVAGEIAFHYENCSDLEPVFAEKAVAYLLRAGDRARSLFAFQDAVEDYQRALAILKEANDPASVARIQMKLGLAYHSMFEFSKAHEAYEKSFATSRAAMTVRMDNLPPAAHALRVVVLPQPLDSSLSLDLVHALEFYDTQVFTDPLFSRLVELTPELDLAPDIAHDWQVLEGGCKYVFHLRQDVLWSDGVPLTAADFEFGWKRLLDLKDGLDLNATYMCDIRGALAFHRRESGPEQVGIRVVDPWTLVIELEQPAAHFLHLAAFLPPMPQHAIQKLGKAWAEPDKIVTYGPFRLEAWELSKAFHYVRNPAYRGVFPGNLERIEMVAPSGADSLLNMMRRDELDILNLDGMPLKDIARQQGSTGYTLTPVVTTRCLLFDTHRPPFDDRRVRQAFVLALDREGLVKALWRTFFLPASGGFVPPGMPGYSPGIALPFDPSRARDLLAQAGYPDGRGFQVVEAWGWEYSAFMHECLGAQWKQNLGVHIPWKVLGSKEYDDKFKEMPPHLSSVSFFPQYPDPDCLLRSIIQGGYDWGNPIYDELVEQARCSRDHAQRMDLYRQAEKILVEDAAVVPLYYHWFPSLIKPWVRNFTASPSGSWFWKYVILEPH